jgi:uncharacterized membrane protein YphA (DoxX/SURF4 family)
VQNDRDGALVVLASTFANETRPSTAAPSAATATARSWCRESTFSNNDSTGAAQTAGNGGAVNNADHAGRGTVSVSGSTFLGNTANGGGGAVDSADNGGKGTLSVSASTFSGDQSDSSSVRAPSARLLKDSGIPSRKAGHREPGDAPRVGERDCLGVGTRRRIRRHDVGLGMSWLIVRVVLAATFGVAGAAKLASPARTRASFRSFGVPGAASGLAVVCVPLLELAAAGALLVTYAATAGAWVAFALVVVFSTAVAAALVRGKKPACSCFGALSSKRAGPGTLVRNALLGAAAAACAIAGPGESVGRALGGVPASAIAAVGALLVGLGALTAVSLQLMRQNGRLLARLEVMEASVLGRAGAPAPAGEDGGQPVGSPAPDFLVWDEDESVYSLADLLAPGEPVVLAFTDPECPGCRTIGPLLDRARAAGTQVALITRGDRGPLPGALRQLDREVMVAYRAHVVPSAVVVDADGRIASELARGADAVAELLESTVSVA